MTNLTKLSNLFLVFWLLFIHSTLTFATDLTFTPNAPIVEQGKQITLSVSGTSGEVIWSAQQGWLDPPTGTQVTYKAPSNPKKLEDVVTVSDEAGNVATLKVKLTTFPLENLNLETFTDPGTLKDMVLSQDGKTLWVLTGDSTGCGPDIVREPSIEQRDANTGKLKRKFTTATSSEGFPKSECPYILLGANDEQLWLGTCDQGLAYYDSYTGKWTVYNKDSGLPDNQITSLLSDGNGGLLVNTPSGLAYRNKNKQWKIFNAENSNLPSNEIMAVWMDKNEGGLWIQTTGLKLTYLNPITEELMVYNTDNTGITFNRIQEVVSDGHGGSWMQMIDYSESKTEEECYEDYDGCAWAGDEVCYPVSTSQEKGIAHLSKDGKWEVFTTANSKLPGDNIQSMVSDQAGGLWIWTVSESEPLKHLNASYEWTTLGLTGNNPIVEIISDDKGGLWVVREGNIVHITNTQSAFSEWTTPELTVGVIIKIIGDGKGGLWLVRRGSEWNNGGDIVHITNTQQLTIFPYKETSLLGRTNGQLFVRDDNEGLWIGTDQGLIHLSSDGTFNTPNPLPFFEGTIANDGNGGLWMWDPSTMELSHFANEGEMVSFNQLGDWLAHLVSLLNDGHGGIWIGTKGGGIAHLNANGEWKLFDTTSGLPNNFVYNLTPDGQGGIWLGTKGGLVHFTSNEEWEIFNTDNSDLPDNSVSVVASDIHGEVWMIIGSDQWEEKVVEGKLVHRKANGEWKIFSNNENSYGYEFLISDGKGGVWVEESYGGSDDYLYHINKDDELLYTFDSANNSFDCYGSYGVGINSFTSDGLGGIWIGGSEEEEYRGLGCLTHVSNDHETTNLDVSSLSSSAVNNLTNDDNGGVWIETNEGGGNMTEYYGGFNHLTVGRKQSGNRAAIIVAGGGNQQENSLWKPTESIANYLYKMLLTRKFVNEEIYYLSPMPFADVTGDGGDDHVVDAPIPARQLVTEDIRLALEWAKKRGPLDQPLYLFFIDHGGPGQLQLAPLTYLEATEVDNWLDDYQTTTGNQVVLVIDACYSGSFLQPLQAPNRAIITSAAANELAYFYDEEGFSRFLIKGLWQSRSFQEAFEYASSEQNKMVGKINQRSATTTTALTSPAQISQTPQLDDDGNGSYDNTMDGKWLRQVQVNGNVQTGDFTLAVNSLTTVTTLIIGESLPLRAKAGTVTEPATEVWAIIRPPRMNLIMDTSGIPRLAFPKVLLSKTSAKSVWETSWNQAIYNGDYEVTFYTKDSQGNIASSDSITITVTGGVEPPSQTTVQVQLNQTQYRRGEHLVATLTEDLTWGYDLYAAVQMPDRTTFLSLKNTNLPVPVDLVAKTAEKWTGQRTQHSPITLLDLDLPNTLPPGQYCLFGILSPEGGEVFETLNQGLWVMDSKCFEIF